DAEFIATIDSLAAQLAAGPTRGLARTKQAILGAWNLDFGAAVDKERDAQRELGASTDYAEGVAAFAAKRTPRFSGR
ncbi:MAG TPA: 2-(1,2-epoxy-1,2-dihydrophenyl)acetyl-CoA isomerase, partial [Steroidobacteraceae bacterium]|nr:2-(1,2-epoxy-1,2-dihydrophenyl)acetyl-CoA isomerase [Steroidobacteraceae bacterium]